MRRSMIYSKDYVEKIRGELQIANAAMESLAESRERERSELEERIENLRSANQSLKDTLDVLVANMRSLKGGLTSLTAHIRADADRVGARLQGREN